jgi:hypothetical protein
MGQGCRQAIIEKIVLCEEKASKSCKKELDDWKPI